MRYEIMETAGVTKTLRILSTNEDERKYLHELYRVLDQARSELGGSPCPLHLVAAHIITHSGGSCDWIDFLVREKDKERDSRV